MNKKISHLSPLIEQPFGHRTLRSGYLGMRFWRGNAYLSVTLLMTVYVDRIDGSPEQLNKGAILRITNLHLVLLHSSEV